MPTAKHLAITLTLIITTFICQAQNIIKGKIIDATSKEPVYGASVRCTDPDCRCGCTTKGGHETPIASDVRGALVLFLFGNAVAWCA